MTRERNRDAQLILAQAADVGFLVKTGGFSGSREGFPTEVLCCGSLDECLAYLKAHPWPLGAKPVGCGCSPL